MTFFQALKYIRGAVRLHWGYCPLCNSSPPTAECPVCHSSVPVSTLHPTGYRADFGYHWTHPEWTEGKRELWRGRFVQHLLRSHAPSTP